jgi:hypothetical protein
MVLNGLIKAKYRILFICPPQLNAIASVEFSVYMDKRYFLPPFQSFDNNKIIDWNEARMRRAHVAMLAFVKKRQITVHWSMGELRRLKSTPPLPSPFAAVEHFATDLLRVTTT